MRFRAVFALCPASVVLAGCVSLPADRGAAAVESLISPRSAQAAPVSLRREDEDRVSALTQQLTSAPIGPDEAVQLALLNNPVMKQLYAELGLAQADLYDASRLSNPSLSYLRLSPRTGGGTQTTWSLTQSFMELLFIGYRTRAGRSDLLGAQQRVAHEVLRLEADVRQAYYRYAGLQLAAKMRVAAATAAELSAELARRFHEAGNISALQLSREQAAASNAAIERRRIQMEATQAYGALLSAMGLPVDDRRIAFLEGLPLPGALTATVEDLQAQALRQRLDLLAGRTELAVLRERATHSGRWRWFEGLTLGVEREQELDGEVLRGGGASIDLPIFHAGRGSVLRAQARLESAEAALKARELQVVNDIATRVAAMEAARATVDDYRLRLLPLRERIVAFSQQQQTFMFIGAFEVLAARREEIETYERYIEAVRDYWIAHAGLNHEIGGAFPGERAQLDAIELPVLPAAGESGIDEAQESRGDAP